MAKVVNVHVHMPYCRLTILFVCLSRRCTCNVDCDTCVEGNGKVWGAKMLDNMGGLSKTSIDLEVVLTSERDLVRCPEKTKNYRSARESMIFP